MTSAMFVSCSNETEKSLDSTPKTVGLTLNLPKMNQTRQIGNQTTGSQKVTVSGTVIVKALAQENGAVLNTYTLDASNFFKDGTPITMPLEVNGTATFMTFDGNINEGTKTSDVNTRQGDATSSAVGVSGGGKINNAVCIIPVTPDMARVEVYGSVGTSFTNISDLKINGIYLNNVKQDIASTMLVKSTNQTTPTWSVAYGDKGIKSNLCTLFAGGIIEIPTNAPKPQADGYNFFPQDLQNAGFGKDVAITTKEDAARFSPHIILNVNYTPKGGKEVTGKWLNVVALKNGNSYIPSFTRGTIYQLDLADLIPIMDQINPPVTEEPDPNAISVAVEVTVADWVITPVKPEV